MNCVLFAKIDQVFSLKKHWENGKKILEKSGNFVRSEKWEPCKLRVIYTEPQLQRCVYADAPDQRRVAAHLGATRLVC